MNDYIYKLLRKYTPTRRLSRKEMDDTFCKTFAGIIDANINHENRRLNGFVKTHDAKCCKFMLEGGMFWCNEITTCEYYNKFIKPKLK